MQHSNKHYSAYATLLDAFESYLDAEKTYYMYYTSENPSVTLEEWCDKMFADLINKINRVPFVSEAADRGTAFNQLVDAFIKISFEDRKATCNWHSEDITIEVVVLDIKGRKKEDPHTFREAYRVEYNGKGQEPQTFIFFKDLTDEFVKYYDGAESQVYCKGTLDTCYGPIDLYGYIDELLPFTVHDIKTTKSYRAGNFKSHWQHIVYPYCLHCMGMDINHFEYNVTNFKDTYSEVYVFNAERDIPKLRDHCERFIEFLETNKNLITDTKVFNKRKM